MAEQSSKRRKADPGRQTTKTWQDITYFARIRASARIRALRHVYVVKIARNTCVLRALFLEARIRGYTCFLRANISTHVKNTYTWARKIHVWTRIRAQE